MPKLRETLQQIKERNAREIKRRTTARVASILHGVGQQIPTTTSSLPIEKITNNNFLYILVVIVLLTMNVWYVRQLLLVHSSHQLKT